MNRLDEIKARADCYEATRTYEHALCLCEQALIADVPALIAAVEAVLELHHAQCDHAVCVECYFEAPCDTVTTIRTALGEEP